MKYTNIWPDKRFRTKRMFGGAEDVDQEVTEPEENTIDHFYIGISSAHNDVMCPR